VHTRFQSHDASERDYFIAAKPRTDCLNRIVATVRMSQSRSKADLDSLAEKIENAWYDVVKGEKITEGKDKGKRKGEVDETELKANAERLIVSSSFFFAGVWWGLCWGGAVGVGMTSLCMDLLFG
jgi:hypothetical protein